jgi:predicted porin
MSNSKNPLAKATALSLAIGALLAPLHPASAQSASDEIRRELDALNTKIRELEQRLEAEQAKNASAQEAAVKAQETTAKTVADFDKRSKALPTLYGKINVALEHRDTEGAGRVVGGSAAGNPAKQWETTSYASRLGVRGEVDLGSPTLKAVYQAEYEIFADNGSTTFSSRNIYAGLQSTRFGRIVAGRIDTPLKSAEGRIDLFNDQRADIDNLIGGQNRPNNAILYTTPKFGGLFNVNLAFYQAEGGADFDQDGRPDRSIDDGFSASIVAEKGIFYAALGYDTHLPARRSVDGFATASVSDAIRFVGGIRSGIWEAGVLAQKSSDQTPGSNAEDTSYLVSGAVSLDKWKIKAQAGLSEGKVSNETGQLLALGADYNFNSKVRAYTYVSTLDLDDANLKDRTFAIGVDVGF